MFQFLYYNIIRPLDFCVQGPVYCGFRLLESHVCTGFWVPLSFVNIVCSFRIDFLQLSPVCASATKCNRFSLNLYKNVKPQQAVQVTSITFLIFFEHDYYHCFLTSTIVFLSLNVKRTKHTKPSPPKKTQKINPPNVCECVCVL